MKKLATLAVPLPARLRNVRLITLIPSRGVPNLSGGRKRNGRNRPERGLRGLICGGEIQFRRLLPPRSLSFSEDSSDINDGETIQSDIRGGVRKKERKEEEEVINGGRGRRC